MLGEQIISSRLFSRHALVPAATIYSGGPYDDEERGRGPHLLHRSAALVGDSSMPGEQAESTQCSSSTMAQDSAVLLAQRSIPSGWYCRAQRNPCTCRPPRRASLDEVFLGR